MDSHAVLVEKIYQVHSDLQKLRFENPDYQNLLQEWKAHTSDLDKLKSYSSCMYHLATDIWSQTEKTESCGKRTKSQRKRDHKVNSLSGGCRIQWVFSKLEEAGMIAEDRSSKLMLLDVGSCYNPFASYESVMDVLALDLCPAPGFEKSVYKCDFLELDITSGHSLLSTNTYTFRGTTYSQLKSLEKLSFEVVVFSFFLSYLPHPKQRLECSRKAFELLKSNGLLFIMIPDSKSVTPWGNITYMKSLKVGLSLLGFKRIHFEKLPHLWCMCFEKLSESEIEMFWESYSFKKDLQKLSFRDLHELFALQVDKRFSTSSLEQSVEGSSEINSCTSGFDASLTYSYPNLDFD